MSYWSNQRALKSAQARYDAMEPPDCDGPEPDDVDERFHKFVCGECGWEYTVDDLEDASFPVHVNAAGEVHCTDCLVDGAHPLCEVEVDMEAFEKHIAEERADAIAEYGMAHVRRCERRR